MSKKTIEVVVTTYKRPHNLMSVLDSLHQGSRRPDRITVIDACPSENDRPPREAFFLSDREIPMGENNYGGFNRFVPMLAYDMDYTLFLDDDFTVGENAIERAVNFADSIEKFGVIGQIGRNFPDGVYNYNDVAADPDEEDGLLVDSVIRAYLVKTRNLKHVAATYWSLTPEMRQNVHKNDDLLLCFAMLHGATEYSYVYAPDGDSERLIHTNLPEPHAVWQRPEHTSSRQEFLDYAKAHLGWQP